MTSETRSDQLQCRWVGSELLVLDRKNARVVFLNPTAVRVWEFVEKNMGLDQIVENLCTTYEGATREVVRSDVEKCRRKLANLDLLWRTAVQVERGD